MTGTTARIDPSTESEAGRTDALVRVDGLAIDFWAGDHWANVVNDVSFEIGRGEALGIVGESGCGKSTTAYALLGFRRRNSRFRAGQVALEGRDILRLPSNQLRRIRGARISLVPQNPTTALTPQIRIGEQLIEAMRVHNVGGSKGERLERCHDLLRQVRLPDASATARKYPHQLSGGQQQRVVIAMALACEPQLVVLDEPTTGLDVTTQAQIIELLGRLRSELGMAMLYVTHNLGVAAAICDRVGVMYAGELVEEAPTRELFVNPRHPYTQGLIASVPSVAAPDKGRSVLLQGLLRRDLLPTGCRFSPRCEFATERCISEPQALAAVSEGHRIACWRWQGLPSLGQREAKTDGVSPATSPGTEVIVDVTSIECAYGQSSALFHRKQAEPVVRDVSFEIRQGETFALVGESGSGKSTIARSVGGLLAPIAGSITFEGVDISGLVDARSKRQRQEIQLVLQNPDASLNPRHRVAKIIGRPLELFDRLGREARDARVAKLLDDVRLPASFARRYPDELSGGERQRVAIARALAPAPRLLLCDEVLSALDVSVQADILDLLRTLQREYNLTYLFISHDLAVVRSISHTVGVLYHGQLCEVGPAEDVYSPPFHPYTHMLLSAIPELGDTPTRAPTVRANEEMPAPDRSPACPFAPRCPWKIGAICDDEPPPWQTDVAGSTIRCHISLDELRDRAIAQPPIATNGS